MTTRSFSDCLFATFQLTVRCWFYAVLAGAGSFLLLQMAPAGVGIPGVLVAMIAAAARAVVLTRRRLSQRAETSVGLGLSASSQSMHSPPGYRAVDLGLAAGSSFLAAVGSAWLMRDWYDLMSAPTPTPLMVAMDLCASFLPFLLAFAAPLLVLTLAQRRAVGAPSGHAV